MTEGMSKVLIAAASSVVTGVVVWNVHARFVAWHLKDVKEKLADSLVGCFPVIEDALQIEFNIRTNPHLSDDEKQMLIEENNKFMVIALRESF